MDGESIFEDRVPEAAARQMAVVLAWFAECELATLEGLKLVKRTPKHELKRHEEICNTLVSHIKDMKIPPRGLFGRPCPRLAARLGSPLGE